MYKITYAGLKMYEREIEHAATIVYMILSSSKDWIETDRVGTELLHWDICQSMRPWKYFFITGDIVVEYV